MTSRTYEFPSRKIRHTNSPNHKWAHLIFEEVDGRMHSRFSAYGCHLSMQKRTLRDVTLCFSVADYYNPKY